MSDFEQLVRASRLYYELGETQNAIAELLGVTRPQVSRILKRARAEGIVEIRIVDSTAAESPGRPRSSAQRYGLDAVHLAPTRRGSRGPDPADGRPARRRRCCATRSATARSSGSATGRRSRRRPTRWTRRPARRRHGRPALRRATGRPVRSASRTGASPRPSGPRPAADGARARRRRRHAAVARGARGRPAVLDLWERLDVALFGIGGRGLERGGGRRRGRAPARCRRRHRRGAGRAVRPRRAVRLRRPCANGSSPSMPVGSGACRSRSVSASGEEQGPADPRRPAGRRRQDARHRRCDGGGRRRPRPRDARPPHRGRTDERPASRRSSGIDLGTNEVKSGLVTLDGRLLALGAGRLCDRTSAGGRAGPSRTPARGGRRCRSGPRARCARRRRRSWRSASTATDRRSSRWTPRETRPGRRSRGSTRAPRARGGRARGRDRGPRVGPRRAAGRALGRAARAGGGRGDALVPRRRGSGSALRLTGVAVAPLVAGPARAGPGATSTRPACRGRSCRRPARGHDRRRADRDAAATHSGCVPVPRSWAGRSMRSRAIHGAGLLEPGDAYDPGGTAGGLRRVLGSAGRGARAHS